jgi:hypothetical protein
MEAVQQDIAYRRGDRRILCVSGIREDLSDEFLSFGIKDTFNPLGDEYLQKDTDDFLTVTYNDPFSNIYIEMNPLDLMDKDSKVYYYDIFKLDPDDQTQRVVVATGNFVLIPNVQNPYSNTGTLPANATRVMVVSEVGNATELYPVWNNTDKVVEFKTLEDFSIATKGYYKEYWVKLYDLGFAAESPAEATVINNTLGGVVITRFATGKNRLTLSDAFVVDKTILPNQIILSNNGVINGTIIFERIDSSIIEITSLDENGNIITNGLNHTIRIIVLE